MTPEFLGGFICGVIISAGLIRLFFLVFDLIKGRKQNEKI